MPKLRKRMTFGCDHHAAELAQLGARVAQLEARAVQQSQTLPTLLTVEDLAGLLRCTCNAVHIAHARGQLPPTVDVGGRRLLWRADDVAQWLSRPRDAGV